MLILIIFFTVSVHITEDSVYGKSPPLYIHSQQVKDKLFLKSFSISKLKMGLKLNPYFFVEYDW